MLILAAFHASIECLHELLDAGAELDSHEGVGLTALMLAGSSENSSCMVALLVAGANIPTSKIPNLRTVFGCTWVRNHQPCVDALERHFARVRSGASKTELWWVRNLPTGGAANDETVSGIAAVRSVRMVTWF